MSTPKTLITIEVVTRKIVQINGKVTLAQAKSQPIELVENHPVVGEAVVSKEITGAYSE